jgi:hypothetical protein
MNTQRKICNKCKKKKSIDKFHKNSTRKDGLRTICKTCSKEYHREHYLKNIDKYKTKARKRINFLKSFVNRYKQFKKCKNCNEKRYWVLEFHHKDKLEKSDNINKIVLYGNFKLLKEEIRKCEVLCSNCHKDLHHKQMYL